MRRTPEEAAHLLTQGILVRSMWPELALEEFADEVSERLAAVGLELASGDGHWVARARDGQTREGFEPFFALNRLELAVLAALYLHLRYLPRQSTDANGSDESTGRTPQPSVALEDIERGLPGYKLSTVQMVLGRLKNAQFVRQQSGRLYAGPYLAAVDEVVADERATELMRDFRLRRFLQRAVRGEAELAAAAEEETAEETAEEETAEEAEA